MPRPKVKIFLIFCRFSCFSFHFEYLDSIFHFRRFFFCLFFQFTTNSLVSVFGLLFSQRLSEIGVSTRGATIIFSVQTTCVNLSGLLIGPLLQRLSFRQTAMIGAFLVVSGLLLTLLSDSVSKFAFTYGLFTGKVFFFF